jgi:hypothetical protein
MSSRQSVGNLQTERGQAREAVLKNTHIVAATYI